jgi:hypothetical protein
MNDIAHELRTTVEEHAGRFLKASEATSARREAAGAWSAKEVLGHLIDSASNNHQRFVRSQFQDEMIFPAYEQEAWVRLHHYQETPWTDLVQLWRAYNLHIARVIDAASEENLKKPRHRHNLDVLASKPVPADQPATLEYFMRDYLWHLKHHVAQITDLLR